MIPTVSIITPNYNRADLLGETAESILKQDYLHWEWVVVDDGSTDDSLSLLEGYAKQDNRIKYFKREGDKRGACICRNQGVAKSTGKYLIFLDSDDILEPFCLINRVQAMESQPDLDFGIFPALLFQNKPFDLNLWWNIDKKESELIRQFRQDAICQGTGILITREAFIRLGQWDETLYLWQDIDLFFRAFIGGLRYAKFFDLPPDLHIRRLDTSLSRGNFFAVEKQMSRITVVKRAVKMLKENGMPGLVPEARFMATEIYSGMVRSRMFSMAKEWLDWCVEEAVVSAGERFRLVCLYELVKFRLYKLLPWEKTQQRLLNGLTCDTSLGKLSYRQ
jgi:glycosyltransferase involved in cell wall biosynthesis